MGEIVAFVVVPVASFTIGYMVCSLLKKPDPLDSDECACPYCGKKEVVSAFAQYHIECPRCERITPAHDWLPVIRKG